MILFHSDLDNTLIYSYKHEIGPEKYCVEIYQGREISFMTRKAKALLGQILSRALFVPTTTRTVEQYERIKLGFETPMYALVCNGGILLEDGRRDMDWYRESQKLTEGAGEEMELALSLLEMDKRRCFELRYLEELFLFTKSDNPAETLLYLRERLDNSKVEAFQNGSKIYVVPRALDKGQAVLRLKERLGASMVIAAGDSEFDIPMLLAADIGMCPSELFDEVPGHVTSFPVRDFTEGMLERANNLAAEADGGNNVYTK